MNNKLTNMLLGLIVVLGIALSMALFTAGKEEEKQQNSTERKTIAATSQTAQIVNVPTTEVDIQTRLAVITSVNENARNISVRFYEDGEEQLFRVEKGVFIYTEFGNSMAIGQLDMGDVIELTYDTVSGNVQEINISKAVEKHTRVTGVSVNTADRVMSFYNKRYIYSRDVVVVSGDMLISPESLNSKDIMTVYEKDNKIISVVVGRGHGYLTLTGVDVLVGGYVNVGGEFLKLIEKNMMLTVTEGEYKVSVSNGDYHGYKTVTINRDKVTTVDFSDIKAEVNYNGNVFFAINVDGARLYLNGKLTDYEDILTLPVGKYTVKVSADGYENYSDVYEVTKEYQKFIINLVPKESIAQTTEQETTKEETTAEQETTTTATQFKPVTDGVTVEKPTPVNGVTSQYETTKPTQTVSPTENQTTASTETQTETGTKVSTINRVYIDGPQSALIYMDGTYLGMAPLNFAMVTGEHTFIVLTSDDVRSYTVNLVEGADDVRYDFSVKN